jgi:hypothetical protein
MMVMNKRSLVFIVVVGYCDGSFDSFLCHQLRLNCREMFNVSLFCCHVAFVRFHFEILPDFGKCHLRAILL